MNDGMSISVCVCIRESHSNAAAVCPPLVEELGLFLSRFISELGEEEKCKNKTILSYFHYYITF